MVSPDQLNASYIVPSVFDENVSKAVARAVVEASRSGARIGGGAKESALRERARCSATPRRSRRVAARLTHVDASGAARMVDVSAKEPTARTALATGVLRTTAEVIDCCRQDGLPEG